MDAIGTLNNGLLLQSARDSGEYWIYEMSETMTEQEQKKGQYPDAVQNVPEYSLTVCEVE
jgi:hypothetical protein